MTRVPDATYPGLPPRPHPATGEPFPPSGRAWRGYAGSETPPENHERRETRLSHKPKPPSGRGPVLVWYEENKRGKLRGFVVSSIIMTAGVSVIATLRGLGAFWWVSHWQIWAIIAVTAILIAAPFTYFTLSAGPDWFRWSYRRYGRLFGRTDVIDLYDLRKIDISPGVVTYVLSLADSKGAIQLPLSEWQCDRRMWDLVYNGILHSVAHGARANPSARVVLELDDALGDCGKPSGRGTTDHDR